MARGRYVSARERLIMPELPEVETVRRGLAPAMEGERFAKIEVRRGDLRWPQRHERWQVLEIPAYLLADR